MKERNYTNRGCISLTIKSDANIYIRSTFTQNADITRYKSVQIPERKTIWFLILIHTANKASINDIVRNGHTVLNTYIIVYNNKEALFLKQSQKTSLFLKAVSAQTKSPHPGFTFHNKSCSFHFLLNGNLRWTPQTLLWVNRIPEVGPLIEQGLQLSQICIAASMNSFDAKYLQQSILHFCIVCS